MLLWVIRSGWVLMGRVSQAPSCLMPLLRCLPRWHLVEGASSESPRIPLGCLTSPKHLDKYSKRLCEILFSFYK